MSLLSPSQCLPVHQPLLLPAEEMPTMQTLQRGRGDAGESPQGRAHHLQAAVLPAWPFQAPCPAQKPPPRCHSSISCVLMSPSCHSISTQCQPSSWGHSTAPTLKASKGEGANPATSDTSAEPAQASSCHLSLQQGQEQNCRQAREELSPQARDRTRSSSQPLLTLIKHKA